MPDLTETQNTAGTTGTLWDELVGQDEAVETLRNAAGNNPAHTWLIVGPPGSGRSNIARAFAAELLNAHLNPDNPRDAEARRHNEKLVSNASHPDLNVLTTDRLIITIDEVRKLVASSYYSPSLAQYRVMIIEDADRMAERSSNVLLKALEEPPSSTVWILCAPSDVDLLPTIRSRSRILRLNVPDKASVAELIERRHGVNKAEAEAAARLAQNHIGMATRLALSPEALQRRQESLTIVLGAKSAAQAVKSAQDLMLIAEADAKALTESEGEEARAKFLHQLGLDPSQPIPPANRAQVRTFDEQQKRKNQRSLKDAIDRILVDLLGLYRDVLRSHYSANPELINEELRNEILALRERYRPKRVLKMVEAITQARERLLTNAAPLLVLEAMVVGIVTGYISPLSVR